LVAMDTTSAITIFCSLVCHFSRPLLTRKTIGRQTFGRHYTAVMPLLLWYWTASTSHYIYWLLSLAKLTVIALRN
jgi:hypothetical protein